VPVGNSSNRIGPGVGVAAAAGSGDAAVTANAPMTIATTPRTAATRGRRPMKGRK
jgi:hypothetical protein